MKSVAGMLLKKGMIIAEDVYNIRGELLVSKDTVVDDAIIQKINRYSIMCVNIKDAFDLAVTHFEKVQLSESFRSFQSEYQIQMNIYKGMLSDFVFQNQPLNPQYFLEMYQSLRELVSSDSLLLDYLYNMVPNEDELTYAHCFNAALIAGVFSNWFSLDSKKKDILILSGYLYDIGKLLIPDELLWQSRKLTDEEFDQIKKHTIQGYNLIKNLDIDDHIKLAALMHHERMDGSGYPWKLHRKDIDIFARYIAIIDAYEAMTSARSYRQSLTPLNVIANFEESGINKFDIELLLPILKRIADTQIGLTVRLSDDSLWDVFVINNTKMSRPILKQKDKILDLSTRKDLDIISIY